jgi:hypothetical protein
VFCSYPVIVMMCSSGSPFFTKLICTPWSDRILEMTAPFLPIILGWYPGSTSIWKGYLIFQINSKFFSLTLSCAKLSIQEPYMLLKDVHITAIFHIILLSTVLLVPQI